MSRWQRFKNWFRRKKKEAEKSSDDDLREFVYLDDVSVDSLVASVRGSILEQITQTAGSEIQSELGSVLGGSSPGMTAEVRSRLQTTTSEGLQTLRRAGIQARFRELHSIVENRRVLRPLEAGDVPPEVGSAADIRSLGADPTGSRWVVRVGSLSRGDVVEVDVELGAEPLFHLASATSQILELWPDNPDLVGLEVLDVSQAQAISNMLSAMLGGLVPIHARALDFDVLDIDGERWLIHQEISAQLPSELVADRRPLEVVGVAADERFWKDQRRVVFAGARYRVLARLVADGTSRSWTPVKMVDTFKDFVPGFSEAVDNATREGQALLARSKSPVVQAPARPLPGLIGDVSASRRLIEAYGQLLGDRVGVTVMTSGLAEAGLTTDIDGDLPSLEASRVLLDPVTDFVETLTGTTIDPVVISETRLAAYREIELDGSIPTAGTNAQSLAGKVPSLLEVEFIAVYW
jgi:hypothetical protein